MHPEAPTPRKSVPIPSQTDIFNLNATTQDQGKTFLAEITIASSTVAASTLNAATTLVATWAITDSTGEPTHIKGITHKCKDWCAVQSTSQNRKTSTNVRPHQEENISTNAQDQPPGIKEKPPCRTTTQHQTTIARVLNKNQKTSNTLLANLPRVDVWDSLSHYTQAQTPPSQTT